MLDTALVCAKFHPIDHKNMYLVGDRVIVPDETDREVFGTVSVISELSSGEISYIVETDDNQTIVRFSSDDEETSFIDNITLDFS